MTTKTATPRPRNISGFCETAEDIEAGKVRSSSTPEQFRSKCRITDCGDICAWRAAGNPPHVDPDPWDVDPKWMEQSAVMDAASKQARAEKAAERAARRTDEDGNPVEIKSRGPARPTSGKCEHCGEPTRGGRFVAGHDAKLKGDLLRAAQQGDIEAYTEMLQRGWSKDGHRKTVAAETIEAATNLLDTINGTWLEARVANRTNPS